MNLSVLKDRFNTPWSRIHLASAVLLILVFLIHVPSACIGLFRTFREVRSLESRIHRAEAMESTTDNRKADLEALRNEYRAVASDLGENRLSAVLLFISQAAKRENVVLTAVKPVDVGKSDNPERLRLDVETSARYHGLGRFVQAVETGRFGLRVEAFRLQAQSPVSADLKIRLLIGVPRLEAAE